MAGRTKHTWTNDEDAKLMDALLELHESGKYGGADNGFKPGYLKVVQQLLDVSLPKSGLKAEPHIKSRMKTWKKQFNIVHDMIFGTNTSGFGWDTVKCCITADTEVWDEYLKSHKEAACFRDKPFIQYDNLCKNFGKDRATGNGATDHGEEDVIEETQINSPIDVEGIEDIIQETQPAVGVNGKRKRGKTDERSKTVERSKTDDIQSYYKEAAKELKDTFKEFGDKINDTISNMGRQEHKEACDMIDKVVEDIQLLPNIDVKHQLKAIAFLSKDHLSARAFSKMTEAQKICYMEMIADGSIA